MVVPDTAVGGSDVFAGDSEVARLMRVTDWAATPLGPSHAWPHSLRTLIRMLLSSRYQMWMGWGAELHFFYNDAYRPTLGAKHPRSLGAPTREVWAEIWDDVALRIDHVMSTGEATWDEALLLLLERNGYPEETYHTFSYSPVFDDAGAIGGLFCVVVEETERVINERRLALVRELSSRLAGSNSTADVLAAVQAALPLGDRDLPFTLTYLFDRHTDVARLAAHTGLPAAHPAAPREWTTAEDAPWGVAPLEVTEPMVVEALPPTIAWPSGPWTRPPQAAIVMPIAQQGQSRAAGLFIAGLNPHRPFDAASRSFLNLFVGQIAAGLANARAYEEERRRAEALAEIDRAKTVFFSNVSHEFRTPLTLMLGPLEELRTGAQDAEVRDQVGLVHRNAIRLLRLVNTLLDFSRIEAGRAQATYEPIDLSRLTEDLVSAFRSATDRAGLTLTVSCPPLGEPVYIDREMWEKIVLNLVSNAFKYTLDGGIDVTVARQDDAVQLRVRDTGTGIPADQLPHLFDRFHRVEGARGRTHEGSGIGLALVQELVALHGGTIAVGSTVGEGSTFTVTVPLGRDHLPADRIREAPQDNRMSARHQAYVDEALQWVPGDQPLPDETTDFSGDRRPSAEQRVLLADDNADMRDYLRRLLQTRWTVDAVANGRDALEAIRRRRPDVLVTDVMMPELDGFGLLEAIRADAALCDLPVVMLSARAGEEAALDGVRAGADDYLVKPFSARDLIARVEAQVVRAQIRTVEETHAHRLAAVFGQAPVGIALLRGPDHVYESANPLYSAMVGERPLVGLSIREALPELAGQGIYELLDTVRATGDPHVGRSVRVSMLSRSGDGSREDRFFDFVYQPIVDADGDTDAIAVVAYDVTELTAARRDAEVASRAKDEFLAMLGHELRNPLAPILTALQLLRLRGITGAERERGVIERQVQHLVGLVDDLLDVSRITRGKIVLRRERLLLTDVIAKAVETASPLLEQKGHQLRIDDADPMLAVVGDRERLAQVLSNLLTNAAKYTEDRGRITIGARMESDQVALSVRDTGIGISAEMLPRIFDLFVQERQALDRAQGGLGLGLAIVRSLVELHGGCVEARSDGPGAGSEFIVRLPAAVESSAEATHVPEPAIVVTPAALSRRVLIVDDNEDAALMLRDALVAYGHDAIVAHDGPAALRLAESFLPDVALLDIGLPVMDGYELARRFHDDPALRSTHLVAVTGYGQAGDRLRSDDAGFEAHLVKPLDLDELRTTLEHLA